MLNQKGFTALIIFVGILIISAIIFGAYYFGIRKPAKDNPETQIINTQSPQNTSLNLKKETDWKTYTNTKYNYSIDYPGDWVLREYPDTKAGAGFNPSDKPGYPNETESISISAGQTNAIYFNTPFEDYVKVAANQEIQNYNKLSSIKKITTNEGVIGYETTWMVQPISINGKPPTNPDSESSPITYFELPGNKTSLIRVTLGRDEDLATYEKMLKTVKIPAILNLTPTPTPDEKSVLEYVIKKYISLKHKSNENSFTVTVSKIEGNYAKGGVSDEWGGGMWFAAKENGLWQLVWDGNGVIQCSIFTLYPNFPTSMISQCWDDKTQNTVKR